MDEKIVDNLVKTQKLRFYEKLHKQGLNSCVSATELKRFYDQFKEYNLRHNDENYEAFKKIIDIIFSKLCTLAKEKNWKQDFKYGIGTFVDFLTKFKDIALDNEDQYNAQKGLFNSTIKKMDYYVNQLKNPKKTDDLLTECRLILSEFRECIVTLKNCLSISAKKSRTINLDDIEYSSKIPKIKTTGRKIFIGNKPKAGDVRQGQIGDCVLMASLISAVNKDPKYIKKCFVDDVNNLDLAKVDSVRVRFFKYSFRKMLDGFNTEKFTIYPSGPVIINVGVKNILKTMASSDVKYPLWPAILEKAYAVYKKKYIDKSLKYNEKLKNSKDISKDLTKAFNLLATYSSNDALRNAMRNGYIKILDEGEVAAIPLLAITGKKLKGEFVNKSVDETLQTGISTNDHSLNPDSHNISLSSDYVFLFPKSNLSAELKSEAKSLEVSLLGTYQVNKRVKKGNSLKYQISRVAPMLKKESIIVTDAQLNNFFTIGIRNKSACKKVFESITKNIVTCQFKTMFKFKGIEYGCDTKFTILGLKQDTNEVVFLYADHAYPSLLPAATFLAFLDIRNVEYKKCKLLEYYEKKKTIVISFSKEYKENDFELITEHQYSVKKIELESNKIILINPHDGSKEIKVKFLSLLDYINTIGVV